MRNLDKDYENRTIDYDRLIKYGFTKDKNYYFYEKKMLDNSFKVVVELSKQRKISKIIDLSMDEEYVLVDIKDTSGDFVGQIKEEYEKILNDILENCTTQNVFQSNQAKQVIKYVKDKYQDDLEYLWKKFPKNAIWRNKKNNKWNGILLVVEESKLGINSDKMIEIIDLRYPKENIKNVIDNKKIWKGYHMNKENWITIRLDESLDIKKIYEYIDNSYQLSIEK